MVFQSSQYQDASQSSGCVFLSYSCLCSCCKVVSIEYDVIIFTCYISCHVKSLRAHITSVISYLEAYLACPPLQVGGPLMIQATSQQPDGHTTIHIQTFRFLSSDFVFTFCMAVTISGRDIINVCHFWQAYWNHEATLLTSIEDLEVKVLITKKKKYDIFVMVLEFQRKTKFCRWERL